MDIQNKIGLRLKELRLKKGISQEKIAFEIGLDRTYITSVERGKRNISIKTLEKFWHYFGLTPKEFFDCENFKNEKK